MNFQEAAVLLLENPQQAQDFPLQAIPVRVEAMGLAAAAVVLQATYPHRIEDQAALMALGSVGIIWAAGVAGVVFTRPQLQVDKGLRLLAGYYKESFRPLQEAPPQTPLTEDMLSICHEVLFLAAAIKEGLFSITQDWALELASTFLEDGRTLWIASSLRRAVEETVRLPGSAWRVFLEMGLVPGVLEALVALDQIIPKPQLYLDPETGPILAAGKEAFPARPGPQAVLMQPGTFMRSSVGHLGILTRTVAQAA